MPVRRLQSHTGKQAQTQTHRESGAHHAAGQGHQIHADTGCPFSDGASAPPAWPRRPGSSPRGGKLAVEWPERTRPEDSGRPHPQPAPASTQLHRQSRWLSPPPGGAPGTPSKGARVVARATFPGQTKPGASPGPGAVHSPCALSVRPPQTRSLEPRVRVPLVGAGLKMAGGKRVCVCGGGETGPQRRAKAVASNCPAPWAASRCHPLQPQSAPRRRLAPASPRLPLPDPGRSGTLRRGGRTWRAWNGEGSQRGGCSLSLFSPPPQPPHHRSRGIPSVVGFLGTGPSPFPAYLPTDPLGLHPKNAGSGEGLGQCGLGGVSCGTAVA